MCKGYPVDSSMVSPPCRTSLTDVVDKLIQKPFHEGRNSGEHYSKGMRRQTFSRPGRMRGQQ